MEHMYVRLIAQNAAPSAITPREIEEATVLDTKLSQVRTCLASGYWDDCPKEYKNVRGELCAVGKLLLRGTRIVMPESLRDRVIQIGHEGHQGLVKTKQRLRVSVWWPRMDSDIENKCKRCHGCQLVAPPTPMPMTRMTLPDQPWQDTAADILGPMPSGEYIFAIVDYYSRYYEVDILRKIIT